MRLLNPFYVLEKSYYEVPGSVQLTRFIQLSLVQIQSLLEITRLVTMRTKKTILWPKPQLLA